MSALASVRDAARRVVARRPAPATAGLLVVVAASLWAHRHLLVLVSWPNDLPFHLAMVQWATGELDRGSLPVDGWFPYLSGGLPQFHHYQSLPHLLTALLGSVVGAQRAVHLTLWLLVGTWPAAVYLGARLLGLDRRPALAAALVAPLARSATGYGFEPFSYLWIGNGLWSQAWGMWVAPLALGASAGAVRTGRGVGRAIALTALTAALHLPTGWFVLLAPALWVLVRPSEWRSRVGRAVAVGVGGAVASAWVVVPFLVDRWATNASAFDGQDHFSDSFGWRRVGGWLLAGDVLDAGRVPVLSAVAAAGVVVAARRLRLAAPGEREVLALLAAGGVLFVGRDPFGPLIAVVPGSSQVFLHRYVAMVQLALVLAAGIGADRLLCGVTGAVAHLRGPTAEPRRTLGALAAVVVLVLTLVPGVRSTHRLLAEDRSWVEAQLDADATDGRDLSALVGIAVARGDGRVFAGRLNGTGRQIRVGRVPVALWLAHHPVDALGFTLRVSALGADLETYLDETSAAELAAFGVRFVVVPAGGRAPDGAWYLARRGRFQLWELPHAGLLDVVSLAGPVVDVDRDELAEVLLPVTRATPAGVARVIRLGDRSPVPPGLTVGGPALRPGEVVSARVDLAAGRVDATVEMERPGALLVRASWHPRWEATVDGRPARVVAVAPTWLAVEAPAGARSVELRYRRWPWTPSLVVLAVMAVLAGRLLSDRRRRADG